MFRVPASLRIIPFSAGASSPVPAFPLASPALPFPALLLPSPSLSVPRRPRLPWGASPCFATSALSHVVSSLPPASISARTLKKKVAMWLGYVGTRYKGLQIQRGPGSAQTIEEELERAIFNAGGILESNFGNLAKISWTRSSRTDKGVHSLCTVISMKMEVPEAAWVNDLDGSALADAINSYLSPFIRVFGIVPVTRSFRARHDCCTRSYDYLLPAAIIGIHPDTDSSEAERRVEKLRSLLRLFEGKHAFHNYTIRRLYRPFAQKAYKSRPHTRPADDCSDEQHDKSPTVKNSSEFEFLDEDDFTDELSDILAGELADEVASTFAHEIQCVGKVSKTSTLSPPGENVVGRRAWWLPTPDGSDKVWSEKYSLAVANCPKDMGKPNLFEFPSQAALSWSIRFNISFPSKIQLLGLLCLYQWLDTHYHKYVPRMPKTWIEKMILNNGVTDFTRSLSQSGCQSNFSVFPSALVIATERDNQDSWDCLRFSIWKWVLLQIRKMIGTAIAVFHELLPGDIIPVSLARHSRIVLPLAPPDGLILARNEFMPFRLPPIYQKKSDIEAQTPPVLRTQQKLPKLEMSSGILNKVEDFCENVLMPDIVPLISAKTPTWSAWMMNLERNVKIPEAEMAEVRAAWTEWREQSVRLRQIRSHICKDVAELY